MLSKVYRYENPIDGMGTYNCGLDGVDLSLFKEKLLKNHSKRKDRPTLELDSLDFALFVDEFKTGCNSLKELKEWFKGYNKKLIKAGLVIVEYVVENKIDGKSKKQCVFHINAIISKKIIEQKK